ncbi:MAG: hypothetical protein HZB51_08655 [Chloroflexi bacterium]|nr:hypothetical protein [Chloroflexota bacterium]
MKLIDLSRWVRSPLLHITLLGTLSWLAYLHLATTYPLEDFVRRYTLTDFGRVNDWKVATMLDFIATISAMLLFGLLAWCVLYRQPRNKKLFWLIFAFAVLFSSTLLTMYPITSSDVFEYVFHSRILVHYGQNPLVVPPIAFKGDPFLRQIPWALHPSPYGPLWVLLTVPGSLLATNNFMVSLFMMKFMPLPFFLGCIFIIAAILRLVDSKYQLAGTLLFAWNPLILLEAIGNGHNGLIMMFFALFAMYLLLKRHWVWVIPVLVAAVLIKWAIAILLIPFLIYCWRMQPDSRARWLYLAKTFAITAVMVLILALPFLAIPTGLLEEANFYSLLAMPSVVYYFLKGIYGNNVAKVLTLSMGLAVYLIVYIISLRSLLRKPEPRHLMLLSVFLIVAYFGIACVHFQPWFVVWPIALGIWINHAMVRRVLLVFTASALFSYVANFFWIWNYNVWQALQTNLVFVVVIFSPPIFIGVLNMLMQILSQRMKYRQALLD